MDFMWIPCGISPCGIHISKYMIYVVKHIPCGFHVDSMWIPCGFHVDSMWIPCGFHVDSMWIPWIPCGIRGHGKVLLTSPASVTNTIKMA